MTGSSFTEHDIQRVQVAQAVRDGEFAYRRHRYGSDTRARLARGLLLGNELDAAFRRGYIDAARAHSEELADDGSDWSI